jgi:hypothetical protein
VNLARRHITFSRGRAKRSGADLKPVAEVVSDRVWKAMIDSSRALDALGIRHALVGALAVGAYGWPRATKDVDFLVDDSAWIKTEAGLVVMRAGLPVEAHGVAVDTLSIRDDEKHLLVALQASEVSEGVPVAPVEAVVYLKLVSPRAKDRLDLVELVRAGIDVKQVRTYLEQHAPHLGAKFEEIVRMALEEEAL